MQRLKTDTKPMVTFTTSYGATLTIVDTIVSVEYDALTVMGRWENGRVYANSDEELEFLMRAIKDFLESRKESRYPHVNTTWEDEQAYYLVMF